MPLNVPIPQRDPRTLPMTLDIVTAGQFFGLGMDASYAAVKRGDFPCPVLRIGGRWRVTRAALLAALGVEP